MDMSKTLPRGVRNKNPGNIERSNKFTWIGEKTLTYKDPDWDERFCVFEDPKMGVRAMMKLLINYNQKHNIKTLRGAIKRWAPDHENNTNNYIKHVADWADIDPDEEWDFTDRVFLVPVVRAMVRMECGHPTQKQIDEGAWPLQWYSNTIYTDAFELAKRGRITSHTMNELKEKPPEVFTNPKPLTLWQRFVLWFNNATMEQSTKGD